MRSVETYEEPGSRGHTRFVYRVENVGANRFPALNLYGRCGSTYQNQVRADTQPAMPPIVHLGLTQRANQGSPEDNIQTTFEGIETLAARGAQIILTQEMFTSPYFCQTEDHRNFAYAEPIPGPTTERLQSIARSREVVIVAALFEKRAPGLYHNTAVIIDADGSLLGVYRKVHIPDDPRFYEKFYFTPGDLGIPVWRTRFGTLGVLICWDQWYPEAARLAALQGAEILLYPTAIGWLPEERQAHGVQQHDAWETAQRAHAISNGVYVAAANRIGLETVDDNPGIHFWGQSFVAAPGGEVLQRASSDQPEDLLVPIDRNRIDETRTHWPFLRDRRIDLFEPLTRRYIDTPPSSRP